MKSQFANKGKLMLLFLIFLLIAPTVSEGWNPFRRKHKRSGEENAQLLIKKVKKLDQRMDGLFKKAAGWAVFPRISKVGIGIGAAAGNGRVYRKGKFIGTTTMSQASIGIQLGGQIYGEIIFFQDDITLDNFKNGKFDLGANISAVIIDTGKAREVGFKDGTIVLIIPHKGLMYEATVSGQKFTFKARKNKENK